MKKWLIGIGIVLAVATTCVYVFIPPTLTVTRLITIKCNIEGGFRVLGQDSNWSKWRHPDGKEGFNRVRVDAKYYPNIVLTADYGGDSLSGQLFLLTLGRMDSIALQWTFTLPAGRSPVSRLRQYCRALDIRDRMAGSMEEMKAYLENSEHVYNMKVWEDMSKDSTLVVADLRTSVYPSTEEVYKVVKALRRYIAVCKAREIDAPMLHVGKDSTGYISTLAIPVDRELPGKGTIYPRRYVPWKVVIGEVRGGAYTAEHAMILLDEYMHDHRKIGMAMPHQSLVTERDEEPDTSRWITRVIVPVP